MVVLHTCKNEEDLIKNEDARVLTRYVVFSDIQAFIVVLVTCKNEEDPIKNEGARVLTSLLFVFFSDAQGQLTPKSAVEFRRNLNSSKLL